MVDVASLLRRRRVRGDGLRGLAPRSPTLRRVRRAELLLYVLIVVGEGAWAAFVPLGPVYEDRFDLSATETGVLLGAAGIAILLVSPPAGVLADRFGARRLTIAGTLLMSVATIAQGVATHYGWLLARSRPKDGRTSSGPHGSQHS